jgi:hypothetical protein
VNDMFIPAGPDAMVEAGSNDWVYHEDFHRWGRLDSLRHSIPSTIFSPVTPANCGDHSGAAGQRDRAVSLP